MVEKLPKGWKWVKLGDVSEIVSKGTTPTSLGHSYTSKGIPFLRAEDVTGRAVDSDRVAFCISNETHGFLSRSQLQPGDLLITIAGTLGRVGYVPEEAPPLNCNQAVAFIRLIPQLINVQYACFACQLNIVTSSFDRLQAGGTIKNLNLEQVRGIVIPLPPLPEQKRIVAILTDRLSTIDKARTATEAQLKAAKALPAAYLREVFDRPEAQKWEKKRLGDVCELVGGMQPPKSTFQYKPLPNYVRLVQIQDFRRSDLAVYIPQEEAKRQFNKTDVMIGRYGPPVFQILRGLSGAYNVALMKTVPTENLLKDYLYYLLQEPGIQNAVINQSQRSAGQSGVQKEFLEQFGVFVPSIDKQQKIVEMLSDKFLAIKLLKQSLQSQLNTINKLPAALLRQAFNGEL